MANGIYLDNSMTTRPSERSLSKMMPYLTEKWGVASAPHAMGQELYSGIEEALNALYILLGAKEKDNFVFTSSGAEAVNQAILAAYFDLTMQSGRNHFITSAIDEAPAIMSIGRLEELSCSGKMVAPDKHGKITAEAIVSAMTPRTALVSLSWVNAITGIINPVAEIAAICKERGVPLHLDITHALGKLYFTAEELGASFISFNGDNIHAPKGTGGLWIKEGVRCSPFILGGIEQGGRRAGSFSVAALAALGEAAKETMEARDFVGTEVARLRNKLEDGIIDGFPGATVFYQDEERIPNVAAIGFPGISNEALLYLLNKNGVYASIGGGSFQQIGLILSGAGVEKKLANSAISFSLSRETTEADIDRAVDVVVNAAKRLRKLSEQLVK
jgi:cysteine desulfurase